MEQCKACKIWNDVDDLDEMGICDVCWEKVCN